MLPFAGKRADLFSGTMRCTHPSCLRNVAGAFRDSCRAVMFPALPSRTDGVGDARVRCAVSIGAVLEADKPAEDLRGLAVRNGAGQLHRVLEAQAAFIHSRGGAIAIASSSVAPAILFPTPVTEVATAKANHRVAAFRSTNPQ